MSAQHAHPGVFGAGAHQNHQAQSRLCQKAFFLTSFVSTAQNTTLREFLEQVRTNTTKFEADGRVLRLKQYLGINARPAVIDAVLDALAVNTRVEALYIQNFEEVRF